MKISWHEAAGYGLIVLSAAFWACASCIAKILMRSGISTFTLMQIRSIPITVCLLFVLGVVGREHLRLRVSDLPGLLLLSLPGIALINVSYFQAVHRLPVAVAALILFSAPAPLFLHGWITGKERLSPARVIALLMSFAGMWLVLQIRSVKIAAYPLVGLGCAFVALFSYSFYLLIAHNLSKRHSALKLALYGSAITSVLWCLLQSPAVAVSQLNVSGMWRPAGVFAACSAFPFVIFLVGLRRVSPTGASIAATSETVLSALCAFLLLNEQLIAEQVVGGVLILAAVILLVLFSPKGN